MTVVQGLTVLAAVGSGMLAGIYAIFSIAIMPALNDLRPVDGIRAMQRINVRILNPPFLLLFMGAPAVSVIAAILASISDVGSAARVLLIAGAVLVTVGSLLITMGANVPRNNALDAFEAEAATADGVAEAFWARYAAEWTRWNHLRALLCLASTLCLSAANIWA